MNDLLERVEAIVLEALSQPPDCRAAYINAACHTDEALRREVESLLAFEQQATDFLDRPLLNRSARFESDRTENITDGADDPDVGRSVGPYLLEARIGAGGMGNVYRARRVDGHFDQVVAVKLIRRGLDTEDMLGRFRTERQMLASLQHPNIARLLDGGSTTDGRPYLVMEYVEGEEILSWCNARRLSIDARIDLVRRACAAVQEAHRRLIVHRDLKPSNLLVTAEGEPKLLDFGIARVLVPDAVDASRPDVTDRASRRLTAAYASPELIAGEPTTTSTDVYSLGVILFELLTSLRPCDLPSPRPLAGLEAVERCQQLDTVCLDRSATPASIRRTLAGDITTILTTALRDDPSRRYGSVEAFAEDLRRYRERLPIAARPDSLSYRVALFIRRNAAAMITAATVGIGFIIAIAAIIAFSVRAESARIDAETQQAVADEVNRFLSDMLTAPDPSRFGPDVTVREVADAAAERLVRGAWVFSHPEVETGVRATLGRTYLSLGMLEQAEPHLAAALAARRTEAARAGSPSIDIVASVHDMAMLRLRQARYDEGQLLFDEALRLRAQEPAPRSPLRAEILCNFGHMQMRRGNFGSAEALFREALKLCEDDEARQQSLAIAALDGLGTLMHRRGDLEAAEAMLRRALGAATAAHGDEHSEIVQSLSSLGLVVRDRGNLTEAQSLLTEAVRVSRAVHGPNHPTLGVTLTNLSVLHQRAGRMDEAEPLLREALAIREARLGEEHPDTAATINSLAAIERSRGAFAEAAALYARALAILRRTFEGDHPDVATVMNNLAAVQYSMINLAGAESSFSDVVAMRRRMLPPDHPDLAIALNNLAVTQIELRKPEQAAANLREAEAIQRAKLSPDHPLRAGTLVSLGAALVDLNRFAEAEVVLTEGLSTRRAVNPPNDGQIGAAEVLLGLAMQGQGRIDDGEKLIRSGAERVLAAASPRQQQIAIERIARFSDAFGRTEFASEYRDVLQRLAR